MVQIWGVCSSTHLAIAICTVPLPMVRSIYPQIFNHTVSLGWTTVVPAPPKPWDFALVLASLGVVHAQTVGVCFTGGLIVWIDTVLASFVVLLACRISFLLLFENQISAWDKGIHQPYIERVSVTKTHPCGWIQCLWVITFQTRKQNPNREMKDLEGLSPKKLRIHWSE